MISLIILGLVSISGGCVLCASGALMLVAREVEKSVCEELGER